MYSSWYSKYKFTITVLMVFKVILVFCVIYYFYNDMLFNIIFIFYLKVMHLNIRQEYFQKAYTAI